MARLVCFVASAMLMASVPSFGDVVFDDPTLDLSHYTATAQFVDAQAVSIVASNCASCGVGAGEALQFVSAFGDTTSAQGDVDLGFLNNTFVYDPSTQGAILSIAASADKNISLNISIAGGNPFGNTFRPMIEQDGVFYLAAIPGPGITSGSSGFNTLAKSGLSAADFTSFDFSTFTFGSQHPNFAGDTMVFGVAQLTGIKGYTNPNPVVTTAYDNLNFDLTTVPAVPEPTSLVLFGSLLPALAAIRMNRRRCN
ncbi:MAG TPA: PEP-CTERM sorting domain-containing protein [Bryobacteraceae bacterium]|nr:PEP-CTERM sorting domain-containing protein [Bryobacteraceae bacterium]